MNHGRVVCDLKKVLFGLYKQESLTETEIAAFNIIILLGKSFIWFCKQKKINVNIVNFKARLSEELKIRKPLDPLNDYIKIFLET